MSEEHSAAPSDPIPIHTTEVNQDRHPDLGSIRTVVLKDGPRARKIATYGAIVDRHTGALHHHALTIKTLRKKQGQWNTDSLHSISLTSEGDNEIQKLHDFLTTVRSEAAPDASSQFSIVDETLPVALRELTAENVRAVCNLKLKPGQERFVAPNALSLAEAHYYPNTWVRAVYAGDVPVGLVLLDDETEEPYYCIWRMMIGAEYQGRGYGRKAVELIADYVRTRPNAVELLTSYNQGEGNPAEFYRKLGFEETGQIDHGQPVMRLLLHHDSQ